MWIKKGCIYSDTHAQLPTAEIDNEILRIYFSSKQNNISNIEYIEVNQNNPSKILYHSTEPILRPGTRGCFDDCGVMPGSIVTLGKTKYLYYTGWNKDKGDVPYGHGIGIAISNQDQPSCFKRIYQGPIMDRSLTEPFLCNSAFVLNGGIYYCSGTGWNNNFPLYKISYRKSWSNNHSIVCIDNDNKWAMSRPFVQNNKMWFSRRTKDTPYRLTYAESSDGYTWIIKNDSSQILETSTNGWDSEMVCYPWIIWTDKYKYMFYNGNGYGASGIGYAEWEE